MSIELSDFAIGSSNMPNVTLTSALKHFISHKFCSILLRINGFKIEYDAHETHKTSIQWSLEMRSFDAKKRWEK